MWGEQLDERTIDSRVWPRTAAIAERFWSPEQVKDVDDMYRRLESVSIDLEAVGLRHLAQEGFGLRQLTGTDDIAALRVFASVMEPVSFGERYHQQKTSQKTQLDLFVDAVRPDPPSRREFQQMVHALLRSPRSDSADRNQLLARLNEIAAALPEVRRQVSSSPRLGDVQMRVEQLGDLTRLGTEAVNYVSSGSRAKVGWKSAAAGRVNAAKEPGGIVRFTILDSLGELFAAVEE